MKQKAESRKVKLQFGDLKVEMTGSQENLQGEALGLLSVLIGDKLRYEETLQNLEPEEPEGIEQRKSKKLQFDSMFQ